MEKESMENETMQKEEALEHLSAIRNHLVDKQIFFLITIMQPMFGVLLL